MTRRTGADGTGPPPHRRRQLRKYRTFAEQTGARLVAEGGEHTDERDALVVRGVRYGQGCLFGRPRPAAEVLDGLPA